MDTTITCRVCGYKSLINHMPTRPLTNEEAVRLPELPPNVRYRVYGCPVCERWEAVREFEEEMREMTPLSEGLDNMLRGLNRFADEVHQNAVDHGWWDDPPEFPTIAALIHSEVSEALEEYRDGKLEVYFVAEREQEDGKIIPEVRTDWGDGSFDGEKPQGVAVELADAILRILDYCGRCSIDIEYVLRVKHEYNLTRPRKHGGKRI
jgi:hypothetical protein